MCVCVPIHSYMIHTLYIHLFSHSHKSYGEKKKGGEKKSLLLTNVLYVTAPLHSLRLQRAPESASPPQKKKKKSYYDKKKRSFLPPCFSRWRAHSSCNSCVSIPKCADGRVSLFFEASDCLSTFHFPSTSLFFFLLLLFCPPFTGEGEEKQKREKDTGEREKKENSQPAHERKGDRER